MSNTQNDGMLFRFCGVRVCVRALKRNEIKVINDRSWEKCRCFDRTIIIYSNFVLADDVAPISSLYSYAALDCRLSIV